MAFIPEQYDSGKIVTKAVAAATFVKGDGMKNSSGNLTPIASGHAAPVEYVAMETVSTTPSAGDLHRFIRTKDVVFVADTNAAPVASTDVNIYADISGAGLVNESASSNDVFFIDSIVGATTDKKVRGWFNVSAPNS